MVDADTSSQDMREEYSFAGGVRGKYAQRVARETTMVVLDPDVAEAFPDAASVNDALRALLLLTRSLHARG
jgi:hypothetical protein